MHSYAALQNAMPSKSGLLRRARRPKSKNRPEVIRQEFKGPFLLAILNHSDELYQVVISQKDSEWDNLTLCATLATAERKVAEFDSSNWQAGQ